MESGEAFDIRLPDETMNIFKVSCGIVLSSKSREQSAVFAGANPLSAMHRRSSCFYLSNPNAPILPILKEYTNGVDRR